MAHSNLGISAHFASLLSQFAALQINVRVGTADATATGLLALWMRLSPLPHIAGMADGAVILARGPLANFASRTHRGAAYAQICPLRSPIKAAALTKQ